MPALDDDREEMLAQELAKGNSQAVAYVNAGYSAKNSRVAASACNRLLKNRVEINERVGELRQLSRTAKWNAEFVVNIDSLTKLLMEDREQAKQLGQISAAVSALREVKSLHALGQENIKSTIEASDSLTAFLESISGSARLAK